MGFTPLIRKLCFPIMVNLVSISSDYSWCLFLSAIIVHNIDCFWIDNFEWHGLREEGMSRVSSFSCRELPQRLWRHVWAPQPRWPDVKKWNLHGQSWWRMPFFLCHQWLDERRLSQAQYDSQGKVFCINNALDSSFHMVSGNILSPPWLLFQSIGPSGYRFNIQGLWSLPVKHNIEPKVGETSIADGDSDTGALLCDTRRDEQWR